MLEAARGRGPLRCLVRLPPGASVDVSLQAGASEGEKGSAGVASATIALRASGELFVFGTRCCTGTEATFLFVPGNTGLQVPGWRSRVEALGLLCVSWAAVGPRAESIIHQRKAPEQGVDPAAPRRGSPSFRSSLRIRGNWTDPCGARCWRIGGSLRSSVLGVKCSCGRTLTRRKEKEERLTRSKETTHCCATSQHNNRIRTLFPS